jgi:hypothetical protein
MDFSLKDSVEMLSQTPEVLRVLLKAIPDEWAKANEGEGTWSPFDILGHLVHGERTDWIPRARIILDHGADKVFEPFDRYAQERDSKGKTLKDLLAEFARLRSENIKTLDSLRITQADLERQGLHPELGIVTLRQLISTWTTHDLAHLHQITRTMARQLKEEVGPWREYLSVLQES